MANDVHGILPTIWQSLREIITWCSNEECGIGNHILLWWTMEKSSVVSPWADRPQPPTPHHLKHCLLRREGCLLRHQLLPHVCGVGCGFGKEGFVFVPDGQVSKSRGKSRPEPGPERRRVQPRKPLLPLGRLAPHEHPLSYPLDPQRLAQSRTHTPSPGQYGIFSLTRPLINRVIKKTAKKAWPNCLNI